MRNKENPLTLLRNAHPCRIEQEYLHIIPGITKRFYYLVDPSFGVSRDQPLHILSDHNLGFQSLRNLDKEKEQVIQPLLCLSFPEHLFRIPAFFPEPCC